MTSVRAFFAFLAVTTLLAALASPAALAREHKEDEPRPTDDRGQRGRGRGPPANESERPRAAGQIVQANPTDYDGRYVAFTFDSQTCQVRSYAVYNVTLLQEIQLPTPCEGRGRGNDDGFHGSEFRVGGPNASLRIHDAPNGLLHLEASPEAIQVVAAEGLALAPGSDGHQFTIGNLTGLLRVENASEEASADPWTIVGKARMWVHPSSGGSPERVEIRHAIKERKVASEIDVVLENGTVSSEVLAYEDVIVKTSRRNATTFRVLVDGNLTSGRTFVVNLGPGVFESDMIGVRYYDLDETGFQTEVGITQADSLEDVLEILPDEGPEYWITQDLAGKHVLVAVPHFSVHVFEILSVPPEVVPVVIWGLVAGIAFVFLGAMGMFRRPSRV